MYNIQSIFHNFISLILQKQSTYTTSDTSIQSSTEPFNTESWLFIWDIKASNSALWTLSFCSISRNVFSAPKIMNRENYYSINTKFILQFLHIKLLNSSNFFLILPKTSTDWIWSAISSKVRNLWASGL